MKSVFDVMKKMGQAQNAFHKLASQMMKDDRSDGIRFAKYLENNFTPMLPINGEQNTISFKSPNK
jgi:hypothetical protein